MQTMIFEYTLNLTKKTAKENGKTVFITGKDNSYRVIITDKELHRIHIDLECVSAIEGSIYTLSAHRNEAMIKARTYTEKELEPVIIELVLGGGDAKSLASEVNKRYITELKKRTKAAGE